MKLDRKQKIRIYLQRALDNEGVSVEDWQKIEPQYRKTWANTHEYFKHLLAKGVHNQAQCIVKQLWIRKVIKWWTNDCTTPSSSSEEAEAEGAAIVLEGGDKEEAEL